MLLLSINGLGKESSITNLLDRRSELRSDKRFDMEVGKKSGKSRRGRRRNNQRNISVIGFNPEKKNQRST